jgi:hypothetical protein
MSKRGRVRDDDVGSEGPLRVGVWSMSRAVAAVEDVGKHFAFLADISVHHAFQARNEPRILDLRRSKRTVSRSGVEGFSRASEGLPCTP